MANLKASCIRKGIVLGRLADCMNEIYSETAVFEETDVRLTKGLLKDVRKLVGPLKKNFKGAAEAVKALEAGTKKLELDFKAKSGVSREQIQADAKEVRENFRKVVRSALSECGAKAGFQDVIGFTGDVARIFDARPGYDWKKAFDQPVTPDVKQG